MIVSDVMTTKLVTVFPDDTLSHAAGLLRQHQFHHLPVVQGTSSHGSWEIDQRSRNRLPVLEGLITSQDIDLAAAVRNSSAGVVQQPWQEQRVAEVMQRSLLCVTPTTDVASAAKLLVERGINCLPVVEYEDASNAEQPLDHEPRTFLVGLLTRSDLLLALARALGAFEPGTELLIPLPAGNLSPLTRMLMLATALHIEVQSVMVSPSKDNRSRVATIRLSTINPAPLLERLQENNIRYEFADFQPEGDIHAR